MQKIKYTLNENIKKLKIEERVRSSQVKRIWERVVDELLPKASAKSMVLAFEKGVLHVAVLSQDIADEIRAYKARLLYAINTYLGKNLVFAINLEF